MALEKRPKKIINAPPIRESHNCISYAAPERKEFKSTPSAEKTSENPRTKKTELMKISIRRSLASATVLPPRNARKPGIRSSTHGLKKETSPATNANVSESSSIYQMPDIKKITLRLRPRFRYP